MTADIPSAAGHENVFRLRRQFTHFRVRTISGFDPGFLMFIFAMFDNAGYPVMVSKLGIYRLSAYELFYMPKNQ